MSKRIVFTAVLCISTFSCLYSQSYKRLKFILSPEAKHQTDSSIVVAWQTSQPTTAQIVIYNHSERKVIEIEDMSENHEIVINQLSPNTIYQYRIIASSGNVGIVTPLKTAQTTARIFQVVEE